MSKREGSISFTEKDREKISSLEDRLWYAICSLVTCGFLTFVALLVVFILSIVAFYYPDNNTNSLCPQEVCSALSKGISAAVSRDDWEGYDKELRTRLDLLQEGYSFVNNTVNKRSGELYKHVDDLQWQINNIQGGRCACNTSAFCTKDRCQQIEGKLEQRVIGVCEDDKSITSVGIQAAADCSQYGLVQSGFYHITAETNDPNGRLAVHVDEVVIFAQHGQHLSVFEPLVKGDKLFFSVNGTKTTPIYSSVVLVSSGDPTDYLMKHRTRKDKLYAPTLMEVKIITEAGWLWTIFMAMMWTAFIIAVVGVLAIGGYYLATALIIPKYRERYPSK